MVYLDTAVNAWPVSWTMLSDNDAGLRLLANDHRKKRDMFVALLKVWKLSLMAVIDVLLI